MQVMWRWCVAGHLLVCVETSNCVLQVIMSVVNVLHSHSHSQYNDAFAIHTNVFMFFIANTLTHPFTHSLTHSLTHARTRGILCSCSDTIGSSACTHTDSSNATAARTAACGWRDVDVTPAP